MDRDPPEPLSTAEAKARLREAARRAGALDYIEKHPVQSVVLALIAGLLAGRLRLSAAAAMTLAEQLLPFIARATK